MLTYAEIRKGIAHMYREGIVKEGMPLAISFLHNWWGPERFYTKDGEATMNEMLYGPVYHNDNWM